MTVLLLVCKVPKSNRVGASRVSCKRVLFYFFCLTDAERVRAEPSNRGFRKLRVSWYKSSGVQELWVKHATMPVMVRSVLISDQVDACCAELLRRHGIAVTQRTKMPKEELIDELKVTHSQLLKVISVSIPQYVSSNTHISILISYDNGISGI